MVCGKSTYNHSKLLSYSLGNIKKYIATGIR